MEIRHFFKYLPKPVDLVDITEIIKAGVCLHCGERLYTPDTVKQFEEIESKLQDQKTNDFQPVGKSFQVLL